jgi:hypothetical protein
MILYVVLISFASVKFHTLFPTLLRPFAVLVSQFLRADPIYIQTPLLPH